MINHNHYWSQSSSTIIIYQSSLAVYTIINYQSSIIINIVNYCQSSITDLQHQCLGYRLSIQSSCLSSINFNHWTCGQMLVPHFLTYAMFRHKCNIQSHC